MKVKCPKCASEYNFPEDKLKPEGTKVRCTSCSTVFLVRSRSGDLTPSKPTIPAATSDDLSAFFGSPAAPSKTAPAAAPSKDSLDDLFDGGDMLGDAAGEDLFGKAAGDSLFGSDQDLFAAKPAAKSSSDDDLFGDADDLFSEKPTPAPARPAQAKPITAKPPASAKPAPSSAKSDLFDDASAADSDDDALHSLFDDSDAKTTAKAATINTKSPAVAAKPKAPTKPAAPAKKSTPDFDWDDEPSAAARPPDPSADLSDPDFTPAIRQDDAEQVLEQTLVRDTVMREAPRPRYGLIVFVVLLVGFLGSGAFLALNPELLDRLLIRSGLREPAKPQVFVSPIVPSGTPETTLVQNRNGYTILVIEGYLRNDDTVPHSFVQLRVGLFNPSGTMVTDTVVFAGNSLSPLQLKNFPTEELLRLLRVEMGESLRNFNVKPGALLPYTAIFAPAPEAYTDLVIKTVVLSSARGERY